MREKYELVNCSQGARVSLFRHSLLLITTKSLMPFDDTEDKTSYGGGNRRQLAKVLKLGVLSISLRTDVHKSRFLPLAGSRRVHVNQKLDQTMWAFSPRFWTRPSVVVVTGICSSPLPATCNLTWINLLDVDVVHIYTQSAQ